MMKKFLSICILILSILTFTQFLPKIMCSPRMYRHMALKGMATGLTIIFRLKPSLMHQKM